MSESFWIWRDPKHILTSDKNVRCEAWEQWTDNWSKAMVAGVDGVTIDLHYAIFSKGEEWSTRIDKHQLDRMYERISSEDWVKENAIEQYHLFRIIEIYGKMEEAIDRDGYVVYESDLMEDRDVLEDFEIF